MTPLFQDIHLHSLVQRTHPTFPQGLPEKKKTAAISLQISLGTQGVNRTHFACISISPYSNTRTIPRYPVCLSVL